MSPVCPPSPACAQMRFTPARGPRGCAWGARPCS
jgi:hypothetical protein